MYYYAVYLNISDIFFLHIMYVKSVHTCDPGPQNQS